MVGSLQRKNRLDCKGLWGGRGSGEKKERVGVVIPTKAIPVQSDPTIAVGVGRGKRIVVDITPKRAVLPAEKPPSSPLDNSLCALRGTW